TPMCQALQLAYTVLDKWVREHLTSFPPVVINITDGEASDGSPLIPAQAISSLATDDGKVLLFNCHLSSEPAPAIVFHDSEYNLIDEFARQLFLMSSVLPESFQQEASGHGYRVTSQTRGFAFNADLVDLIKFLAIGTRPANLR